MVWSTRTTGLSLVGAAMIGGLAIVAFRESPVPVDLTTVTAAPLQVTIDADGKTRIRDIFEVSAPITGTALRAPVAVGDPVVGGETVIARVEPATPSLLDARSRAQSEAAVAEAEAALAVAQSQLNQAEEQETFARMQFERTQTLANRGVATLTQLETDTQAVTLADAGVAAAKASVAMAQGTLTRARAALVGPDSAEPGAQCCVALTAPVDGVVLALPTISEHPVTAGQLLVTVGDPTDLEVVADLLSSDAVRIAPGSPARIERWGGDGVLEAVLERIDPAASTQVSALGIEEQRVKVVFSFTSPPDARGGLGHGYSVFLRVIEWQGEDVLQVPLGALFRRGAGWAVYAVQDGIAEERAVTLGQRGARRVQVLEGVSEGDRIVTHPSDAVANGVSVVERGAL